MRYTVWVLFLYWGEQDGDTIREISYLEEELSWKVFSPKSDIHNKIYLLCHLLKWFRNILVKPHTLRSDCSFRSNLIFGPHCLLLYKKKQQHRRNQRGDRRSGTPPPPEKSQKYRVSLQYWSGSPKMTKLTSQHSMSIHHRHAMLVGR